MDKTKRKIFLLALVFLFGCATSNVYPPEDIVMRGVQNGREFHIHIEKGYLSKENHNRTWVTESEYATWLEKRKNNGTFRKYF